MDKASKGREWDGYSNNDDLLNQQSTNIGGRRKRGAINDNDKNDNNHNNHDDLIANEDVDDRSDPSACQWMATAGKDAPKIGSFCFRDIIK